MTAPDLRDHLLRALGDAYVLERELGGGGMSRVFQPFAALQGDPRFVELRSRVLKATFVD